MITTTSRQPPAPLGFFGGDTPSDQPVELFLSPRHDEHRHVTAIDAQEGGQ